MPQQTNQRGQQFLASRTLTVLGVLAFAGLAAPAVAQQDGAAQQGDSLKVTNEQLLDDFSHYVLTANYEMAYSVGEQLRARNLTNIQMMELIDANDLKRFEGSVQRAMRANDGGKLQATAGKLLKSYETGKLELARNPDVIAANIRALKDGQARAKLLARQGLVRAGEYAVPQLLETLVQGNDPQHSMEAQSVLIDMGRQAIMPLAAALPNVPDAQKEKIARVMGLIPYKQSMPFLADQLAATNNPSVRAECQRAIERLGGAQGDAAGLYRSLAEAYYNEKSEVTSFPGETHQLLWNYTPNVGLFASAIQTPVFHEAVAMSLLERSMSLEQSAGGVNPDTLALWVASNYSREFDTPQGYVNPAYPVEGAAGEGQQPRRSADYFGVASGPNVAQRVLARAITDRDTPLARRSLAAVEKTAGGRSVLDGGTGRAPLASALTYPNRRVQADAALAISAAQPMTPFAGSERVVPTLAGTVRGVTDMYAAVVTSDNERYQTMRGVLEKSGFKVLPQGTQLADLEGAIAEAPAVDLIVGAGLNADKGGQLIMDTRAGIKTAATPILLAASQDVYIDQSYRYASDATIAVRPIGAGDSAMQETIKNLIQEASGGPITSDEAGAYAARSLAALRDLAVSNNPVLRVSDAASSLITALGETSGATRMDVADVLARIPQDRCQRAIMDAALAAEGTDQVALLGTVADSAKRFGSFLEERHVTRLVEIARTAPETEATAAASLMGALNLPNSQILPLIPGGEVAQR
ncbi:MAG TPA: hypothetical protein VHN77_13195 [Phycisphaerales bacterium]|nr:hypothetical protein [Phycisphaerales bacterium]